MRKICKKQTNHRKYEYFNEKDSFYKWLQGYYNLKNLKKQEGKWYYGKTYDSSYGGA